MEKSAKIRLIYSIFLGIFTVAVGIAIICVAADIYYSGKDTGVIYSRAIVGERLTALAIPLIFLIAAIILGAVFPLYKVKASRQPEDVHYTIGNFSKRKSARLGDVVERAITMLEAEGKFYDREVAVLDTIDNVALRTARRVVHADSLIRVRSLADTVRTSFVFDVVPGDYDVRLSYRIDSLDRNTKGFRSTMWLERADGSQASLSTASLRRHREEKLSRHFKADSTHRRLHVVLLGFVDKPQRPHVTVRDFEVVHTPPLRTAVEQLYEQQLGIRIFADEFFGNAIDRRSSESGFDRLPAE